MPFRPPSSPQLTTLWKALAGCCIGLLMLILPLAEVAKAQSGAVGNITGSGGAVPSFGPDPAAYQSSVQSGLSDQPEVFPCGSVAGVGVTCTDWGQYNLTIARVKRQIDHQLMMAAFVSALNAMTYFSQTIAYDTAEWVANGFEGQAPGIYTDPFGEYTQKLALNAAGEFLGSFSEEFTENAFGLDLCRPPNFPQLALEFQLSIPGLLGAVQRPSPACEWTTITQNWEQAVQSLDNAGSLQNIRANFTTGGNDISFGIGAHLAFFDYVAAQREAGIQERLEGQGYRSVSNFITGEIETPAQLVRESVQYDLVGFQGQSQQTQASILLNNAWNVGFPQLGLITASTFTNVLLSKLLGKLASGLFKSSGAGTPNLLDPFAAPPGSINPDRIFSSQFSDLITPKIIQTEAHDLLTELSACPTQGRTRLNCAIEEFFASAIRQGGGLTVRQAVTQGFVNENWELIPSTRASDNQDPACRLRAFCASNLRKLRLARVLPIGWELAADSPENQRRCATSDGCVTLKEVVDQFQNCNDEGQLDAEHPFCHLIDPNWVLTILPAQCQVHGYGNQLIAGASQRLPECQDTTTCLRRDANGQCVGGYGYCMAEQTFWQFDAPKCDAQFATCRTYNTREGGRPVSYLRSTIDYGSCNASNVGCMWYAAYRDPDQEGGWTAGVIPANIPDGSAMDRVYFDATVEPCDASGDGCTALLRVEEGRSALNLIQNGSFEVIDGTPLFPAGWNIVGGGNPAGDYETPPVAIGEAAAQGNEAWAVVEANIQGADFIEVAPLRQYVLSFFARGYINGDPGAEVLLQQYTDSRSIIEDDGITYFQSAGCTVFGDTSRGIRLPELEQNWQRFSCTFVASEATRQLRIGIRANGSQDTLIDAVQLEEADAPRPFVNGINTALAQVNMKVPPTELQCSGTPETDNVLCVNYAQVCRQNEAGCRGYRPADGGNGAEIPAVLTPGDLCPNACIGYSEYRKQASTFDLVRSPDARFDDPDDDTSAFFVPSTAFSCSAQDVGCERFTNLDAQQGDASEQAFSYLRACELPGGDTQTYYTWEGSDTSGYQLKTWSLKKDLATPFPQGPKILERAGPDGILKNPAACSVATYLQALDPDCRQFYDPEGNVFYRFESQTVLSSESCIQLRKEGSTQADCQKTGGSFNAATGQCVYRADPGASRQCDVTYAGCRAYVGTQGRAQEEVFYEEFSADTFQVVSTFGDLAASPTTVARSEESLLVGDTSLRVQTAGNIGTVYAGPMALQEGALYEVSFWAKVTTPSAAQLSIRGLDGSVIADNATLSLGTEWRTYRMGPITLPADVVTEGRIPFHIEGTNIAFIDKIRVERVQDMTYVVKDSWNTPAVCDQTPEGVPSPQAMLGCRAYVDRGGNEVAVRQFSSLCRETAIGCTAYVNTRNTVDPYRQNWEADPVAPAGPNPERTSAFADRYDYYIEDQAYVCREEQLSCRAFGRPNYTQDRLALDPDQPFTTVYFKDDPATYDEALCSERELFCDAFTYATDKESGTSYFRAPGEHACEYRRSAVVEAGSTPENITTTGRTYDGWFRVGTDIPCHPDFLQSGSIFGMRLTGDLGYNAWASEDAAVYDLDAGYRGWTGTCPQEQSECTELRDINDTSDPLHPTGRPYYVINNTQLDTRSCNDQVNPGDGCVLFRDTSQPSLDASTVATYDLYQTRAYEPVNKLNCEAQPDHPNCLATTGRCVSAVAVVDGVACRTTEDCALPATAFTQAAVVGTCQKNDANAVIRVNPDRACSAWLACSTAETVFDPQDGTYKSICADLALCSQAGSPEGDSVPFCANYIDRSDADETILTEYSVLNAEQYASRPVGFGAQDYSGVSIPDQFQVMDTTLVPLAAMLSQDAETQSRLAKDYRLAVSVPIQTTFEEGTATTRYTYGAANAADLDPALAARSGAPTSTQPYLCVYKAPGSPTAFTAEDQRQGISYGIMTDNEQGLSTDGSLCWLSVNQARPTTLREIGGDVLISDNLNVPALITQLEQLSGAATPQAVEVSFPGAQCKAAPQPDAPFDNRFVLEWDNTITPPVPSRVRTGYGSTNFCEFDEECSCSYKRVEYGGATKFYEPLATDVVNAVCVGGNRHGQACVLHAPIAGSVETNQTVTVGEGDNAQQVNLGAFLRGESASASAPDPCGGGGVCRPVQQVNFVRGVTGQCLQYDLSRPLTGSRSEYECLVWNPNPLFSGPSDPYHWTPSAGFQPPQSSGRYYCISPYRPPQNIQFSPNTEFTFPGVGSVPIRNGVGFLRNEAGTYTGQITRFEYRDSIASDRSCDPGTLIPAGIGGIVGGVGGATIGAAAGVVADLAGCDGNEGGGSLDGARAAGTDMGFWCEEVDDEGLGSANDFNAVRLITTGKGSGRGYAEYAVLANWQQIGGMIAGYPPDAEEGVVDPEIAKEYALEDTIAGFTFSTPDRKLGCAYSPDWVEGINVSDYDEPDIVRQQDSAWVAGFRQELARNGGKLDRRNAQIVTENGSPEGIPVQVECLDSENSPDTGLCYLKTWTLDYRAEGQRKFQAFLPEISRQSLQSLSKAPVYGKCESSHSWFSIRAVFENTNKTENGIPAEALRPAELVGPFRFVGFWVTACSPQAGPRYIYTRVNLDTADICRELAETISKDSADSAAFTDRNWAFGSFSVPKLGYQWESTNVPFGASLATRTAGEEPLYMSGVRQDQSNVLRPPTFTFSGQTYFRGEEYPKSNWGILSNIFARIYRIYTYNSRAVTRSDWACTNPQSPNFGQWCPNLEQAGLLGTEQGNALSRKFCGYETECVPVGLSGSTVFSERVCNAFSGVNRGLNCSADPDICHAGPVRLRPDGVAVSEYAACEAQGNWVSLDEGRRWRCEGGDCPEECAAGTDPENPGNGCGRSTAIDEGAFRCAADSALAPGNVPENSNLSYCTRPQAISPECPKALLPGSVRCLDANGGTVTEGSGRTGTCEGYAWAQCRDTADCTFEAKNFWPTGSPVNNRVDLGANTKYLPQFSQESGWDISEADPQLMYYVTRDGRFPNLDNECDSNDPSVCIIRQAFTPAFPGGGSGVKEGARNVLDDDASRFFGVRIGTDARGTETASLYPGFVPLIRDKDLGNQYSWAAHLAAVNIDSPPFIRYGVEEDLSGSCQEVAVTPTGLQAQPGKCRKQAETRPGECEGGSFSETSFVLSCQTDADCSLETPICTNRRCLGGVNHGGSCTSARNCPSNASAQAETQTICVGGAFNNTFSTRACTTNADCIVTTPLCVEDETTRSGRRCLGGPNSGNPCLTNAQCQTNVDALFAHYAACEPRALMLSSGSEPAGRIGLCRGGVRSGALCYGEQDCIPEGVTQAARNQSAEWCNPVTSGAGGNYGFDERSAACWPGGSTSAASASNRPFLQDDPALDNNICTRPAGYWPNANLCNDPTDEYCGLFWYDRRDSGTSVRDNEPLPTDVTAGLYTPAFPELNAAENNVSTNSQDYSYVDFYTPIPPTIAAPDVRTCQGGTCKVSELGTFSIDTVNAGRVNGGAGNHVATVRFYAWASHEQMPLRRVLIDWGDGQQTELPDAFLKNRKPFCETQKECVVNADTSSGLTCQTDSDCPPGTGQCLARGACASGPRAGQACVRDRECDSSAGGDGICQPRLYFGNDGGACEEQFFEFRHVYTCGAENQPNAACLSIGRCSGDPDRQRAPGVPGCLTDSDCAAGDSCIEDLVQTDGCFDTSTESCRFTPRILLVDNWGWCAGECRAAFDDNESGKLIDAASSRILHPNGGCYDASRLRVNTDLSTVGFNECSENFPNGGTARPWVIFPGSVQVRVGVTQ